MSLKQLMPTTKGAYTFYKNYVNGPNKNDWLAISMQKVQKMESLKEGEKSTAKKVYHFALKIIFLPLVAVASCFFRH